MHGHVCCGVALLVLGAAVAIPIFYYYYKKKTDNQISELKIISMRQMVEREDEYDNRYYE